MGSDRSFARQQSSGPNVCLGQKQTSALVHVMSALPPKADIHRISPGPHAGSESAADLNERGVLTPRGIQRCLTAAVAFANAHWEYWRREGYLLDWCFARSVYAENH